MHLILQYPSASSHENNENLRIEVMRMSELKFIWKFNWNDMEDFTECEEF